jgi:hypothetical protein
MPWPVIARTAHIQVGQESAGFRYAVWSFATQLRSAVFPAARQAHQEDDPGDNPHDEDQADC